MSDDEIRVHLKEGSSHREQNFLAKLESSVWPFPDSPYARLFANAGIDASDVATLTENEGLEGALGKLRDEGVYISYEEYHGVEPARRGSATFTFSPQDFVNPRTKADLMGQSGGTRSSGVPVPISFAQVRRGQWHYAMTEWNWGIDRSTAAAVWFPVLPSAAGLWACVAMAGWGLTVDRWFTQIPPPANLPLRKRLANLSLPFAAYWAGTRIPRPEHVAPARPEPVLQWCLESLANNGKAYVIGYAGSLARVAQLAVERGISLEGLVMAMAGEPVTAAKTAPARECGARVSNFYGFVQGGGVASNCPFSGEESLHLWEHDVAVVHRMRQRSDGAEVSAFLYTTLSPEAGTVLINIENDDYGDLSYDAEPCRCEYGRIGFRKRISNVRGMSKIVAGGVTLPGEFFERLVEETLPSQFGGGPGDFQFVEEGGAQTSIVLRVDQRIGDVNEDAILDCVRAEMLKTEAGLLAEGLWSGSGALKVVRAPALATRSGKVLPFEIKD